jgi:SAM-dependent methyltransferase
MRRASGRSSLSVALAKRVARSRASRRLIEGMRSERPEPDLGEWLTHYFDDRLSEINDACAGAEPEAYALFRELDDDLWALLLSRNYSSYPHIRALLPELPDAALQRRWNGTSGLELMSQSKGFYVRARSEYSLHAQEELAGATVLDFGCGWGRITRFLARDIAPGALFGCDPAEDILDVCRRTRVPATLARCEYVPDRVPFDQRFDLVVAFSVFTHISEAAHEACLRAIHASLKPGGIMIATVRPPSYLAHSEEMRSLRDALGPDPLADAEKPRFLFAAHRANPSHPQYQAIGMTYGETVINLSYIRKRWSQTFELLDVGIPTDDIYQVALTLRRRD